MLIYVICPILASDEFTSKSKTEVARLENEGHSVYYPPRDGEIGNRWTASYVERLAKTKALRQADEVHIMWDGFSHDVLFELGAAFALGKKITTVPAMFSNGTPGHVSFVNLINYWEQTQSI